MKLLDSILDYADAEFGGRSYNGPSLMKTLRSLSPEIAASRDTHEGYSAWAVAHHVASCKQFIAASVDPAAAGDYPWPPGMGDFTEPDRIDAAAWSDLLAYLEKIHATAARLIRALSEADLAREIPAWKINLGQALAWYVSHDAYHASQIRNMGVPGLKAARVPPAGS